MLDVLGGLVFNFFGWRFPKYGGFLATLVDFQLSASRNFTSSTIYSAKHGMGPRLSAKRGGRWMGD